MQTPRQKRLPIETYALLTESAPELGEKLDHWYRFYKPATPGECEHLDMAVMASVQLRRVHRCLTETVNQEIRTAIFREDCDREDDVNRYRAMLDTQPGLAVVGLKRSALGVRFLIGRWERLLRLITEEGTLYGNDRDEAIHYQGARATHPENLYDSEGAYLTWLYCLMSQPKPKDEHFVELGNERFMPAGLMDRKPEHWLGKASLCQKLRSGSRRPRRWRLGGENGIGVPTPRGDIERAAVMAAGPLSAEEIRARREAEEEAARTAGVE